MARARRPLTVDAIAVRTRSDLRRPSASFVDPSRLRIPVGYVSGVPIPSRTQGWQKWVGILWASSGTQPVLNNGTLQGWYKIEDRWAELWVELKMGSTTTYGTGVYRFSTPPILPVNTRLSAGGTATYFDAAPAIYLGDCITDASTGEMLPRLRSITTVGLQETVTPTAPFTWASGDQMVLYDKFRYTN